MSPKDLEAEVLKLPRKVRAALAAKLIESLNDTPTDFDAEEHERVWVEEALRRMEDLEKNPEKAVPFDEAIRKARQPLIK